MYIKLSQDLQIDCCVDADFARLWGVEHDHDPTCLKSRTCHLIEFTSCPLFWVSKLQTRIDLSTMESECITLIQSMRDLSTTRGLFQELNNNVFDKILEEPSLRTHSSTFAKISQSVVYENDESYLKFVTMPIFSSRTKHIAILYYLFRSKVNSLEVNVVAIDTNN